MTAGLEARRGRTTEDPIARLDRWLRARATPDRPLGCTIRAADHDAVTAVAGRHGYTVRASAVEEPGELWVEFRPAS